MGQQTDGTRAVRPYVRLPSPVRHGRHKQEAPMHPDIAYDLAKLKIAEDLRAAERERLIRQAGRRRDSGAIDAVAFRDRVARLFGISPNRTNRSRPAGAQP